MQTDHGRKQIPDPCSGASEVIGAILLISLVIAAVSIIAVVVFSQPLPSQVPSVKFMTGVNSTKTTLYIYHNGGDTMNAGDFDVLLDGVNASYSIAGGGSQWSLGKNLIVPISAVPTTVEIVYRRTGTGSGGGVLLDQASADIVSSRNISPDQLPYLDCSAVRNWDCAEQIPPEIVSAMYLRNVSTKRVTLMKFGQSDSIIPNSGGSLAYHLNFTVLKEPASMSFGGSTCSAISLTKVNFTPGTKISLYFTSYPNAFTIYGAAPSIWEMTGGLAAETYVMMTFPNGTTISSHSLPSYALCDTFIEEYTDFDSTLAVTTDNTNKITSLTVNKTAYLIGTANTSVIRLNGFKPTDNGLFMISFMASTGNAFYVIGWADSIQINGGTPPLGL
ncbi:MAG: type IV pilin N-terminal domain-containing protein [Methanoregula sp.]